MKYLVVITQILAGFLISQSVFAQDVQPVKNGDKLTFTYFDYSQQGSDPVKEVNSRPGVLVFESLPEGYLLKNPNGNVTKYNKNHAQISFRGNDIPSNQVLNWMPKDGLISDKKWSIDKHDFQNGNCSGQNDFVAVSKEVLRDISFKGKPVSVKAFEVQITGKSWSSCGNGTTVRKIVFSKDLNILMEYSFSNFDARGFLLRGSGNILKEVNE